jgi:CubicO group peptidase (beta-lactamase class C family)
VNTGAPIVVRRSNDKKRRKQNMSNALYRVFAAIAVLALVGCNQMRGIESERSEPEAFWDSATPESQGISSEMLREMVEHVGESELAVDGIIIYRNGTVPLEAYFGSYNERISHNLKSTSKGVISALVGIAIDRGIIGGRSDKVYDFFPEYEIDDPRKSEITIEHLLTMTAGLDWNENDLNSMYTFFVSGNIAKRVLNLPVVDEPGTKFNYNTGLTHLLSAILSRASGMSTLEFAQQYLFDPLDIHTVMWTKDRSGEYVGGSELFLTPRAMIKFGVMYLNNGRYNGKQVVPREWVEISTTLQTEGFLHGSRIHYGYLWWLDIENSLFSYLDNEQAYVAMGIHGQRIYINETLSTVVVITANQENEAACDMLIRDFIMPAIAVQYPLPPNPEAHAELDRVLAEIKAQE